MQFLDRYLASIGDWGVPSGITPKGEDKPQWFTRDLYQVVEEEVHTQDVLVTTSQFWSLQRTQDWATLGGGWNTGRRIESRMGWKRKSTKFEVDFNDLRDTLDGVQSSS